MVVDDTFESFQPWVAYNSDLGEYKTYEKMFGKYGEVWLRDLHPGTRYRICQFLQRVGENMGHLDGDRCQTVLTPIHDSDRVSYNDRV